MATVTTASHQWATRPEDERFLNLPEMATHFERVRDQSEARTLANRSLQALPVSGDMKALTVVSDKFEGAACPSHWAFGQLASLAGAPAGYLRTLPAPMAADCINYGLHFERDVEEMGVLVERNGSTVLRAATGPNYGRVWNADVVAAIQRRFGDGINGAFRVPGEFGQAVQVTKKNTTLYAGDRDLFIFLADEQHRVTIPNRRNGESGELAHGFFVWNSEVGAATLGLATFLFDYVCCNRIVWGAEQYQEVKIRHTSGAPDRFVEEVTPAIEAYAAGSTQKLTATIAAAQAERISGDQLQKFLADRFGKSMIQPLQMVHQAEEGRPIETLWDVTTAATAYARGIKYQDERVKLERIAGHVLDLVS